MILTKLTTCYLRVLCYQLKALLWFDNVIDKFELTVSKMNENNCIQIDDEYEIENEKDDGKWILRDGSDESAYGSLCSTMKDSYRYMKHKDEIGEIIGHKREILLKKFEEEAINEIMEECQNAVTIEEYCTEYDKSFNIPGFEPDDTVFKKQEDLYKKYPLYSSMPTSFYSYKLMGQQPKEPVYNVTKNSDKMAPFKRSADFSKPINEVLHEIPR